VPGQNLLLEVLLIHPRRGKYIAGKKDVSKKF